jgi:hypothetical protein
MPQLNAADAAKALKELVSSTYPLDKGESVHNICCEVREHHKTPRHKPHYVVKIVEFWSHTEAIIYEVHVADFVSGREHTHQMIIFYDEKVLLGEPGSGSYFNEDTMRSLGVPSHEVVGEVFGEIKRTLREHSSVFEQPA